MKTNSPWRSLRTNGEAVGTGERMILTQRRLSAVVAQAGKGRKGEPYSLPNSRRTERKMKRDFPLADFASWREKEESDT